MNHINLDTQGEAVKQFFLELPADPEGAVVEVNGRAVARLVPIRAGGQRRAERRECLDQGEECPPVLPH